MKLGIIFFGVLTIISLFYGKFTNKIFYMLALILVFLGYKNLLFFHISNFSINFAVLLFVLLSLIFNLKQFNINDFYVLLFSVLLYAFVINYNIEYSFSINFWKISFVFAIILGIFSSNIYCDLPLFLLICEIFNYIYLSKIIGSAVLFSSDLILNYIIMVVFGGILFYLKNYFILKRRMKNAL